MSWRRKAADAGIKLKPETPLTRETFKAISQRQWNRLEGRVTRAFTAYFANSVNRMATRIARMEVNPDPDQAIANAAIVMSQAFDLQEEHDELIEVGGRALLQAFIAGARTEEELMKSIDSKATSAEEIAQRLEYDVPDGISLGPYPDWMIEAGSDALFESFQQDYWLRIPTTTRNDVHRTVLAAFEEGGSVRQVARSIMDKHGGAPYTEARARNVARTELGHMANAGHAAGMEQLQMESGIVIKKVWMSIFGPTTRDDHAQADNQKVPVGFLFNVGGEECRWPSDIMLSAKQRCNCQCTTITDLAENALFNELDIVEEIGAVPDQAGDVIDIPPPPLAMELPIVDIAEEPEELPFPDAPGFTIANPDAKETLDKYAIGNGRFTPDREELHRQIVEELVSRGGVSDQKTVYMMGGGPASGKGSLQKHGLVNIPDTAVLVDPDEIKKMIPEFAAMTASGDPRAAAYVHEESSMLAKRVIADLVKKDADAFLDGTGDGGLEKFRKKAEGYRARGHRIVADYVTVDTSEALRRSDARGDRSGRYVPHEYIKQVHSAVSDIVPKAMSEGLYDELRVWDNNVKPGEKPRLLADYVKNRADGPDLKVLEPDGWRRFLDKKDPSAAPAPVPVFDAFPRKKDPAKNPQTFDMFRTSGDRGEATKFTRERSKLHKEIEASFVDRGEKSPNKTVYMMGGGPAAGKGSLQRYGLINIPDRAIAIDPDEVKKFIPEYQFMNAIRDDRAAAVAHEESSILTKRVVASLVEKESDVFLDGTGDGGIDKFRKKVEGYRKNGHKVVADYVTIDTEEALRRSDARGERTGRYVPHEYIKQVHSAVSDVVPKAVKEGLYDELRVWDNMGEKPKQIADYKKGREDGDDLQILDQEKWDKFLNKANQ